MSIVVENARDRILREVADSDLPAVGSAVAKVVSLASSEHDSVKELAHFLLCDVSLTQKLLRMANTVGFRTSSGVPVTTISRAIFLLGFETVKASALAMILVDGMRGRKGNGVRNELSFSLAASVIGREMARRSHFKDAEEAAIASLFKNIGRLVVASHDHHLYEEVADLIEHEKLSPSLASMRVIGCGFEYLGESVLREWGIPDSIVLATAPLPSTSLKVARTRGEWMQQVASFSAALAFLMPRITDPGRDDESRGLLSRFGVALSLNGEKLAELIATVADEIRALTENADLAFGEDEAPAAAATDNLEFHVEEVVLPKSSIPDDLMMHGGETAHSTDLHPSGKPLEARRILLAGVQEMVEMIASGRCKINDLMLLALETLHGGLGFRYATVCLREPSSGMYRSRLALGCATPKLYKDFVFAATGNKDLFFLAMKNDADLMISDASTFKIASLLPAWHKTLIPEARSFMILPLVVRGMPLGYIYADRAVVAPEGIPPDEVQAIRMIKMQIISTMANSMPTAK